LISQEEEEEEGAGFLRVMRLSVGQIKKTKRKKKKEKKAVN
jgi:hypothetical protein